MNFSVCKKAFKVTAIILVMHNIVACGVISEKSNLVKFLDGENPDVEVSAHQTASVKKDNSGDGTDINLKEGSVQSDWLYMASDMSEPTGNQKNPDNKSNSIDASQKHDESNEPEALTLKSNELRCLASDNVSFSYKKRVAVLPMTLVQRQDAVDMPYIEREFSQALTQRLSDEMRLTPFDASSYHSLQPYSERSRLTRPLDPELVRATAQDLNTQFLISGKLLDVSFDRTNTHAADLVTSLKGWKSLARETYQRATDSYWRRLNIELSIYDGPSGALIKRQRYSGEANHPVNVERHQGLESQAFWQSDYGQLLDETLTEQALMISRALECLPMRAQVSRVDFDVIEINAGLDANLMPGDRLRIFHREPAGRDPQGVPKHRWKYYGGITVKGVFPLKSVAILDDGLAPDVIDLGDIVQAW